MRNIISLAHISLDGFMAGTGGKMDFIVFNDELAHHTYPLFDNVDLAVYGRVTYGMMEGYWPAAGDAPDAGEHEKRHSRWYKDVRKIVASRTLAASKNPNVRMVGDDIVGALRAEKQKAGGDIICQRSGGDVRPSRPRLVLVEDEAAIRESLGEALQEEGFEVVAAANGREALDILRNSPRASAILLDLMMPVMDGWDFRHEQLNDPSLRDIPVLVVSAAGFSAETIRMQLGDIELVSKPVHLLELLEALGRVCVPGASVA